MKYLICFSSFLMLIVLSAKAQVNNDEIQLKVLKANIPGKIYVFGKWNEIGDTETHLKFLGQVRTRSGITYKVMNSKWFWGQSHRATSRILIFSKDNQYLGNYPLGMTYDLPIKLLKGKLIFSNDDNPDCDSKTLTSIDLKNGLPKELTIWCKTNTGDSYFFNKK